MRKILAAAAAALLLFCAADAGEPEFVSDLEKALDESVERGAPILAVFGRDR